VVRVDQYVERALYDPESGFYETGGRAGRRGGAFITSPEVGPLFGAVAAGAIDEWWRAAGRPAEWIVVDAGAGPGTFARSILAAGVECAPSLRMVCVERSRAQRQLHPDTVESRPDLPAAADVIVANELLDNLPFGILERTSSGWVEVAVTQGGGTAPDTGGVRVPCAAAAAAWVAAARRRLRPGGRLLCLDYADRTANLGTRPWTDWVRSFAGQVQLPDPFAEPGRRDITVVVPHDQLPVPDRTGTQAGWLSAHGIGDLVEKGRAHWRAHAASPDLEALRMRSRATEAEALLDPAGLGGFWVGEWTA
jgi:SAM-dependent MidA family methyltransferase